MARAFHTAHAARAAGIDGCVARVDLATHGGHEHCHAVLEAILTSVQGPPASLLAPSKQRGRCVGDLAGVGSLAAFMSGLPQLYVSLVGLTAPATYMCRARAPGSANLHLSGWHCFHESRALPGFIIGSWCFSCAAGQLAEVSKVTRSPTDAHQGHRSSC